MTKFNSPVQPGEPRVACLDLLNHDLMKQPRVVTLIVNDFTGVHSFKCEFARNAISTARHAWTHRRALDHPTRHSLLLPSNSFLTCAQETANYPQRTAEILRRKPTRIELKPDDREEYFAQKNKGKQPEQADSKDAKQSEKDTRIGIVRPR